MWALLVSALLCGIFFASANAAEPRKMIVPYTPLTGASTPFWIAIEARLFQNTASRSPQFLLQDPVQLLRR